MRKTQQPFQRWERILLTLMDHLPLSYPRNPITSLRTYEGVWFCQALGQVCPVLSNRDRSTARYPDTHRPTGRRPGHRWSSGLPR